MSKWLCLSALFLAAALALAICAQVWGWPHVTVWAIQGAIAGGLAVYILNRRRKADV